MRNLVLSFLTAIALAGAAAGPSMAIVDDGSGCGCIRPCHVIKR